ncbi:hypothetical protein SDC9_126726 [bioreactor metagenome]|uniref:Uncharacterized protein n=1 Tax=bioreactor metagenome TaxID=1076179 RepID=A0A645CRZ5_9ZZZZ
MITKMSQFKKDRKMLTLAVLLAVSNFFATKLFESKAFVPTPVPAATAIIKFCIGKAKDTEDNAFSLICATNALSTIL